jgi:hypothetical protein
MASTSGSPLAPHSKSAVIITSVVVVATSAAAATTTFDPAALHCCAGSTVSIREATALYGLKRPLRVANVLTRPAAFQEAALSKLGTIGLQRMMEAMAKLRSAFGPGHHNQELEAWKAAHGGKDPLCEYQKLHRIVIGVQGSA